MRIAILDKDKCNPVKCNKECQKFCPVVRMGKECVVFDKVTGKAVINEELCSGCGICIKKCPFKSVMIINLPEKLKEKPTHRYGNNGFELFGLPAPKEGSVVGMIGRNGIGKSTSLRILSGELIPNMGDDIENGWEEVIREYRGLEVQSYLEKLSKGEIRAVYKPQYVDNIPKVIKGSVSKVLNKADEKGKAGELLKELMIDNIEDREIDKLSGGELQRLAIAVALSRDANFYFIDEPSSYLDIYQRLNVAKIIRKVAEEEKASVIVIEHDLAVLDYLSDYVHIVYGVPAAYGIVTQPRGVSVGINAYLSGYMKEENIKFRDEEIKFYIRPVSNLDASYVGVDFTGLKKKYPKFELDIEAGQIYKGEVVGVFGANALGKSTFAKMLAGEESPDQGELSKRVTIAYKPQYISTDFSGNVRDLLSKVGKIDSSIIKTDILNPLHIEPLLDKQVTELSGGELQRVAIADALLRDVDFYVFDEPSAYLDVEQRLLAAKTIRRRAEAKKAGALVIDHDVAFLDYVADKGMVFLGEPSVKGSAHPPVGLKKAMNIFLGDVGVTFHRDAATMRPRVNKEGSLLDRKQKEAGEYYYYDKGKE